MNIGMIIFIVILIVLIIIVIRSYTVNNNILTKLSDAKLQQVIPSGSLATSPNPGSNYAYSIWFYINDWNYHYQSSKTIFAKKELSSQSDPTNTNGTNPQPSVSLDAYNNNMTIEITCYGSSATSVLTKNTFKINNIPIQLWVNLIISVYGKTLDTYINGKLVQTNILTGPVYVNNNLDVYVTPDGGFDGSTSKFSYYPNSLNPEQAWNIYEDGYSGGILSNLTGSYQLNISVLQNGIEETSLTI
jgi:hypothetical protein